MKLFGKDTREEVVIVSEIGVNHGGDISWIIEMLPKLKYAGVDAVKLQVFTPERYVGKSNKGRFDFLSKRFISQSAYLQVLNEARLIGIPLFATPLSEDWIPFLVDHNSTIKVASGDFTFLPTIEPLLRSQAHLILSTGAVSNNEISTFISIASAIRGESKLKETVALLHCVSAYPPPLCEANLNAISDLKLATGLTVGFSSHFLSDSPIFCALALGARIFEIHVTDDRSRDDVRDHELSRTPNELKELILQLRQLNIALSSKVKEIQPSEAANLPLIRKGLVTITDISSGEEFSLTNISFARPQTDLTSSDFNSVLGRKAATFIPAYTSLHRHHLQV